MHGPEDILTLLKDSPRGRLLDASCGKGHASNRLAEVGFEVTSSTFEDRPVALDEGIACSTGVDLNRTLPFAEKSFDYVVLQEVIEHLENPAHVIREANRILDDGGRWIMTTPNAGGLRSRVHFLLSGFVKGRRRPSDYTRPPGNYANLFIPLFPTLHYLLYSYGFRIERTGRANRKWASYVWLVLLYPWVALSTWYYTRPKQSRDDPRQQAACADARRWLLHPHLLLDENLILVLRKEHGLENLYVPEPEVEVRAVSAPPAAKAPAKNAPSSAV